MMTLLLCWAAGLVIACGITAFVVHVFSVTDSGAAMLIGLTIGSIFGFGGLAVGAVLSERRS